MNIRIDYYTGTGGSEFVAKQIATKLTTKGCVVTINRIIRDKFITPDNFDYYVLLFAVHSFNAPQPVFDWVKKMDGKMRRCAVISVSGAGEVVSNTASRRKIIKSLSLANFEVDYEEMVKMPNNWVSVPKHEKCEEILKQLPSKVTEISDAIFEQRKQRKSPYWIDILISAMGQCEKLVTKKFGKGIKVTDSCTGCGLCAGKCCSSNIVIENGRAVIGDRCDMCLGCIYGCPQQALVATYAGFQIDKKGYNLRTMQKTRTIQSK